MKNVIMKLFFLLILFPFMLEAQVASMFVHQEPSGPTDVDVIAWVDEIDTQGGTAPSDEQLLDIETMVVALKADGIWSNWDGFFVPAQNGSQIAGEINMIDPGGALDLTKVDSPVWASDVGFKARPTSGSEGHYDMENENGGLTQWGLGDHCFGFSLDDVASSQTIYTMGNFYGTGYHSVYFSSGTIVYYSATKTLSNETISATPNSTILVNRTSTSSAKVYQDGSELGEYTPTISVNLEYSMMLGALRSDATTGIFAANTTAASIMLAWYGASLSTGEIADLQTALDTYLDTL